MPTVVHQWQRAVSAAAAMQIAVIVMPLPVGQRARGHSFQGTHVLVVAGRLSLADRLAELRAFVREVEQPRVRVG